MILEIFQDIFFLESNFKGRWAVENQVTTVLLARSVESKSYSDGVSAKSNSENMRIFLFSLFETIETFS